MAIKSYKPLIRLAKQVLDEKRRKLGELMRLEQQLLAQIAAIEQQVVDEQAIASRSVEVSYVYPAFASSAFKRRDVILDQVAYVRRQIELARIEVQGAHQEVRKYEIAEENRLKRVKAEREKREQLEADELSIQRFGYARSVAMRDEV